jgi:hypothetical protein
MTQVGRPRFPRITIRPRGAITGVNFSPSI